MKSIVNIPKEEGFQVRADGENSVDTIIKARVYSLSNQSSANCILVESMNQATRP